MSLAKAKHKSFAAQTLQGILSLLPKSSSTLLQQFTEQFFAKMPPSSLAPYAPQLALDVAAAAFMFFEKRKLGEPNLRIVTPSYFEKNGVRSRLVVEVLNDDAPFLVDSLSNELLRLGFTIYETIHPIFASERDGRGKLVALHEGEYIEGQGESLIHFQISSLPDSMSESQLEEHLRTVLANVFAAYRDWHAMEQKAEEATKHLQQMTKAFDIEQIEEALDFIEWLRVKNFIFLGAADYDYFDGDGEEQLSENKASRLGILKLADTELMHKGLERLPQEVRHFASEPGVVQVMKANRKSPVHRPVYMDLIRIKRVDSKGKVIGETRFIGLFTSTVYYQATDQIPFVRTKAKHLIARAAFDPTSHDGKMLKTVLEFFPRDELFQISEDELFDVALGVMSLEARPDVRVFCRKDRFERYVSCLVYTPRDKFSTFVRKEIEQTLEEALHGTVSSFYTQLTDSPLARVHLIVKTSPGHIPAFDTKQIEAKIRLLVNQWIDELRDELHNRFTEKKGEWYFRQFQHAFPKSYINAYPMAASINDILAINEAFETNEPRFRLQLSETTSARIHLKFYTIDAFPALSEMLPLFEHMGFRVINVIPYSIRPVIEGEPRDVVIRDFELALAGGESVDLQEHAARIEEALVAVWQRLAENDWYNALVARAGLSWRQVALLRAYGKYLKQTGLAYNETYVAGALGRYPAIAQTLSALFENRFDPAAKEREAQQEAIQARLQQALAGVSNRADDFILRRFADTIAVTWRTNFYQKDAAGNFKSYISFKLDSANVPELPLPRPYAEIFVYSTRTEGIHLRGGKVARGGLRWSDRPEDFRTEILGLMKAQMVKNAVIVPVGSKGGFVVKQPPSDGSRDAMQRAGIACYREFLSGLLDLTDNIIGHRIVPPSDVVRYDGDDPYLVVAADKGTATFSDIANAVSIEYGFWLGDAFASGGSAGYDHKKMGITARGAWVSVERHFHELGKDIRSEDFTCTGVGDMAGDVFGNGMLLSDHIRLIGAFNHVHIFLDPHPDPKKSFAERKRLFELPRSSWTDYNPDLISKGGGVFERSAKQIPLSPEIRSVLGTDKKQATPDEVIRLILMAEVDLLWNGGIGTYVKAEDESQESVGDAANNALRINAGELRAKVVGEGGNLGFTQKGRIAYARKGGKINTDSIDNSAGVDCSDHEVNIKIALAPAVESKKLKMDKRDALLAEMTDEVAALVLRDNQLQTQAITIAERQCYALLEPCVRLMQGLERRDLLDRAVEKLPSDKDVQTYRAERRGLSRPELSILLSYAKLALYHDIISTPLVENDYFLGDLLRYFPEPMQKKYANDIAEHRLRKEIIGTVVTNSIVNRTGITFVHSISEDTGFAPSEIASAYVVARDAFGLRDIWGEIEALDGKIPVDVQVHLFSDVNRFIEQVTRWFLQQSAHPMDIAATVARFEGSIHAYRQIYREVLSDSAASAMEKRMKHYIESNVPQALAERIAALEPMGNAVDIALVALETKCSIQEVAKLYYQLSGALELGWVRGTIGKIVPDTYWERLAIKSLIDELMDQQRRITHAAILMDKKKEGGALTQWMERYQGDLERFRALLYDLKSARAHDLPMLVIALKALAGIGVSSN